MEIEMTDYPRPPFAPQAQNVPGSQKKMDPYPDCGEQSYKGSGRLANKIALITGADSGIGRAVAIAFAREGADVAIAYLDEHEDARETARWVEEAGRQCLLLPGDIAQKSVCQSLVDKTVEQFGRIDVLVNNAAFQMSHETLEEISGMGENLRYQHHSHVSYLQGCRAAYEGGQFDHQYIVGQLGHAQADVDALRRHQGCNRELHGWSGAVARQQGHSRQQRSAGTDLDAADCGDHDR
jgi:NAD(P)-dependent dehydrogenase (short-subunit alcohol dehydrogenase family)